MSDRLAVRLDPIQHRMFTTIKDRFLKRGVLQQCGRASGSHMAELGARGAGRARGASQGASVRHPPPPAPASDARLLALDPPRGLDLHLYTPVRKSCLPKYPAFQNTLGTKWPRAFPWVTLHTGPLVPSNTQESVASSGFRETGPHLPMGRGGPRRRPQALPRELSEGPLCSEVAPAGHSPPAA